MPSRSLALALAAMALLPAATAQAQKAVRISKTGEVVAVLPGIITARADGALYNLKVNKDRNIVAVTGKLSADQLQPGMIVRCVGTLKGSVIEEELAEVKVYGAADGYQFGILQDAPDQPATITGQLSRRKDNQLTISAGRKKITARLAENANLVIDTKDYSILKGGERIAFDGTLAGDGKTVGCRKITVTVGPAPEDESEKPRRKKAE